MRWVGRSSLLGLLLLVSACTSSTEGTASPEASASATSSAPSSSSPSSSSPPPAGGLDAGSVEEAVAGQFEDREGVALDLSCDERMAVEVGAEYRCAGTTADGEDLEILIRVTDDTGTYTWEEA